jgi:hypothetical protein
MAGVLEIRRLMPGYMKLRGDGDEEVESETGNIKDYGGDIAPYQRAGSGGWKMRQ